MILRLPDILPLERPLIGLDLETTGVSSDARIVELGLEIHVPGQPTKEYQTLINPGIPIPPGATAVHGITDDDVKDAPRFEQIADSLLKGLRDCDYAGYNVRFDLRTLASEFKRVRRTWSYEDARIIDAFRLWQVIEQRSLAHAKQRWIDGQATPEEVEAELGSGGAHTALYDIKTSTRVIAGQLKTFADVLPRDVQALHELCSPGWYDNEGKLQFDNTGELCFSFGKHRGRSLEYVAANDYSYLRRFILGGDFSERVKDVCAAVLKGKPAPRREPVAPIEEDTTDETAA